MEKITKILSKKNQKPKYDNDSMLPHVVIYVKLYMKHFIFYSLFPSMLKRNSKQLYNSFGGDHCNIRNQIFDQN